MNSTNIFKSVNPEEAKITLEWEVQEGTWKSILSLKFCLCPLKMKVLLKVVRTGGLGLM